MKRYFQILCLSILSIPNLAQSVGEENNLFSNSKDTLYIAGFNRLNDFRLHYGSIGSSLRYGSNNQTGTNNTFTYFNNVNDILGIGLTYKIIDFDIAYSLPDTKLQVDGLQNLKQFRLSGTYYGRRLTIGGYWTDSQGLIISDAGEAFQSSPDVHVIRLGVRITYNFNYARYSFKGAHFQNELQKKSSGGFLARIEPYYRKIGIGVTLVPASLDQPATYGEQTGLRYVSSPGISFFPGYGYTLAIKKGKFFVSPIVLLGGGVAVSAYKGNVEEHVIVNTEWAGIAEINAGYNGNRIYIAFRSYYEVRHFNLNPTYFTSSDIKAGITAGYRFGDLEKSIPRF